MTTHTPGPWTVSYLHILGPDYIVARVDGFYPPSEPEANARLISKAPELLAMLQVIIGEVACEPTGSHYAWVRAARDLIAKATTGGAFHNKSSKKAQNKC